MLKRRSATNFEISIVPTTKTMRPTQKMLSFVRSFAVNTRSRYVRGQICSQSQMSRYVCVRDRNPRTPTSCATNMQTSTVREKALKLGIEAAVEDFVKTGTNICIGGGSKDILIPLLDAIAVLIGAEGLIDVAIVTTNESTSALIRERNLPSDLAVNFKRTIDVFIAPVTVMDENCNAILDSTHIATDKFAAEVASQIVLVIHEDDFENSRKGLRSLPVQLPSFLPDVAAESLRSKSFIDAGIRESTLRSDGSNIADVSLAPNAGPQFVAEELERTPLVIATGLLSGSSKTTVVLATNDFQPIDMTPPLHALAKTSDDARRTRLTGEKREDLLKAVTNDWRVIEGQQEALLRSFSFPNARRAQSFVRYVHYVSSQALHHPEIKESYNRVQICLTTYDAGGISELDALFARDLSRAYDGMRCSK